MTEAPIDQIEFRWDREYDLGGIASSFGSDAEFRRWNALLKPYAGISGRGRTAAAEAPSSAVYLTFRDDRAALILRSLDSKALRIDSAPARSAGADRLDLVARALIGPRNLLTAEVAMRIAASDPLHLFAQPPGQVGRGTPLNPLSFSSLHNRSTSGDELRRRAQGVPGLAPLIAAVLGEPARPVTLVLSGDEIRGPLRESRALALLWASRRVLKLMLTDPGGRVTDGWRSSFSTCEAPLGGGDGRHEPAIVFRERGLDGPPLNDAPREVRPDDPIGEQGTLSTAADLLDAAYRLYGDDCAKLVRQAVRNCHGLKERIEAVVCSTEITTAIDSESASIRRRLLHRPVQEPATRPDRPQRAPAPAAAPVTAQPPAPPVPRRGDRHLVQLYRELMEARERPGSLRIMDWVAARTARGAGLDEAGFCTVLKIMDHHGWFVDRLDGLPDAPERMADLMHPLFAAGIGEEELNDQLRRRHNTGTLPPVMADALGILAARLEPDRADWLAERCLVYALAQGPPDTFGGGGDPHPVPVRESPLLWVLRLPARELPADVAGALAWLTPVLLAVMAFLFLV
ncbi:hypothetical protein [Actinomadura sp. 3N407]|uniref:hypothetical protein n=1 Tax=Actinomadura sp. 3N407 TaxID=3457423 RepID=UPI003FCDB778